MVIFPFFRCQNGTFSMYSQFDKRRKYENLATLLGGSGNPGLFPIFYDCPIIDHTVFIHHYLLIAIVCLVLTRCIVHFVVETNLFTNSYFDCLFLTLPFLHDLEDSKCISSLSFRATASIFCNNLHNYMPHRTMHPKNEKCAIIFFLM